MFNNSSLSTPELVEGEPQESADHYILPLISLFGLTGNIISLVTIFHSRLRRVNANIYLIVLTLADSVFLTAVLGVFFRIGYKTYEYCVGVEYVLAVSSYISSWATAALTIERYLAIAHPLAHMKYAHVDRARVIMYWLPIPFLIHLIQFYILIPSDVGRKCFLRPGNYQIFVQILDTILCYILPCGIIVILNILVATQVKKSQEHFLEDEKKNISRRTGGSSSASGTWTRILWVMPLLFVLLNTPFYIFALIEIIIQEGFPQFDRPLVYQFTYNIAHYLYYLNFAIDVLVYAFSSANFRKTAVIAWKRIVCPGYVERQKGKNLETIHQMISQVLINEHTSRGSFRMASEVRSTRIVTHYQTGASTTTTPLMTEIQVKSTKATAI